MYPMIVCDGCIGWLPVEKLGALGQDIIIVTDSLESSTQDSPPVSNKTTDETP